MLRQALGQSTARRTGPTLIVCPQCACTDCRCEEVISEEEEEVPQDDDEEEVVEEATAQRLREQRARFLSQFDGGTL